MDHVGPGWVRGPESHSAFLHVKVQGLGPSILTKDLKSEVERKLADWLVPLSQQSVVVTRLL